MGNSLQLAFKLVRFKFSQRSLETSNYSTVNTEYGHVKGRRRNNTYSKFGEYYAFEGIPYAEKPLEERRFRTPEPPKPWPGVLDCLELRSGPPQEGFFSWSVQGSEDCLYLNVYSKDLYPHNCRRLPVMVWIYGGGFVGGEASREVYSPDYFMQKQVVLVTFNYRVGVLGFLSFKDPNLKIPGNAGLKDQVMVLKWVKKNIHNFGGDPNNITLFGESAGAASAHFLMLTKHTKDLFHKVILQSGTSFCPWANTPPRNWAFRLAQKIGYKGQNIEEKVYNFLLQSSTKNLVKYSKNLLTEEEKFQNMVFVFGPVIEQYESEDSIITRPIEELLQTTWTNEIPMIIGGTSFEGLFYFSRVKNDRFLIDKLTDCVNLLPDDVKSKHERKDLEKMALKLKEKYFGHEKPSYDQNLFKYLDLMSYRLFWHSIFRVIKARAEYASGAGTFCYLFDFYSKFFNHYRILNVGKDVEGVSHGDDVSYLFLNAIADKLKRQTDEFKCLVRMIGMWYSFASKSDPNCEEIKTVDWKKLENDVYNMKVLKISKEVEFEAFPLLEKLKLWDSFYKDEKRNQKLHV